MPSGACVLRLSTSAVRWSICSLAELALRYRLSAVHRPRKGHGGEHAGDKNLVLPGTGVWMALPPGQTNSVPSAFIMPLLPNNACCRLLGPSANTSHKQHGPVAADQGGNANDLLHGKAADNTAIAQVTAPQYFAVVLQYPHWHVPCICLEMCKFLLRS